MTIPRDDTAGRLCLTFLWLALGCDLLPRPGDTDGVQRSALWEQRGRLVVEPDSVLTLVRMRVETLGVTSRHDVLLARFEFDPSDAVGDEHALTLALDLGRADTLRPNRSYSLGPAPAGLPAAATVACLCGPLRPDSVRGALSISTRGQRMIQGRVDAVLYFTSWGDTARHVVYHLRQRLFGVRP